LLRRYGWSLVALGRAAEAIPLYRQSLDYYEQLNKLDPANVRGQWDIAVVCRNLAHAHQQRQEWKEARTFYERIETLMEPVITQMPEGIRRAYGEMLVEKGAADLKLGNAAAGRIAARRGLDVLLAGIDKVDVVTELERAAECLLTVEPADLQNVPLARTLLIRAGGEKQTGGARTISLLAAAESRLGNREKARTLAKTALEKLPPGDVTPYRRQMTALLASAGPQQLSQQSAR
jgi:tetratricopeptide (TPR) repeat protein